MKKYNIFAIQFLFSSLAAYLWQPEDSCKVSISFCIEANALTDIDNLDSTRQLLKNIYNYTSTNFNYHFVPSTAFIYGYNTTLQSFNFEQLFEYNSFFLNEGFSEALENVPIRSESEKVQTEDAQQGAKECLGRVAALSLPYGSNNMIVFVSKHFLNVTMLNDLKISTEYVSVVTKVQEPVSSFFTNVCGGKAVNTCGEPAMYFGVNRESCSGYLGGDTCMLTCPAPYSTDRRIIKCFIGTGWVIDEKCKGFCLNFNFL